MVPITSPCVRGYLKFIIQKSDTGIIYVNVLKFESTHNIHFPLCIGIQMLVRTFKKSG